MREVDDDPDDDEDMRRPVREGGLLEGVVVREGPRLQAGEQRGCVGRSGDKKLSIKLLFYSKF